MNAKPCHVLVTGASGFIGGRVTARLAREPGLTVRAGSRRLLAAETPAIPCRLDVRDLASLEAAMAGVDAVVHCAVGDRATTVDGTGHVLQAAQRAGVRVVVQLSSVAVYGQAAGSVAETSPPIASAGHGYAHWKAAAESLCRNLRGPAVVMLRPAIVYGPGSELWIAQAARRIVGGSWGTFGAGGTGLCNPVHVADVAEAVLAALRADVAHGEAFNISGPEYLTWNAWFLALAAAIGRPDLPEIPPAIWRRRSRRAWPLKALVRALPMLRARLDACLLGAPAASELALFALKATYPNHKAASGLGWRPHIGLAEGLADSAAWLQAEGIL